MHHHGILQSSQSSQSPLFLTPSLILTLTLACLALALALAEADKHLAQ